MPSRPSNRYLFTSIVVAAMTLSTGADAQAIAAAVDQDAATPLLPILRCPAPSSATKIRAPARPRVKAAAVDNTIHITSDDAVLGVDSNAQLKGHVRLRQADRELSADEVDYVADNKSFNVRGHVQYSDPVLRASGRRGSYGEKSGANFVGAEFELPERPARGTAAAMSLDTNGVATLNSVSFSTCPNSDPDWRIRARSIELDTHASIGVGRGATIEFKGVPILYLPWMSFPLGTERKSGFLFPNFGHGSRTGFQLTVPYYWNIAPQYDLTLDPSIYSSRGINLSAEFRFLTVQQNGRLAVDFLPHDRLAAFSSATHPNRSRVHLDDIAELPGGWRAHIDAENVSDKAWYEDFAQGPEGTSLPFVKRLAELTYRDAHWRLRGEIQQFQTIDTALLSADRLYARMPGFEAQGDWRLGQRSQLALGFDSEIVDFQRNQGVQGWRADIAPRIGLDFSAPGYFLRPTVGYRLTRYALTDTAPGISRSPQRSLPFAMFDAGLAFERGAGDVGQRRITLESRLLYLYTPYRDQSALPQFDTAVPDLNLVQLYSTNRYLGADRVSDANQISVGVTTRLFSSTSGAQILAANVGQILYFETPRVRLPGESLVSRHSSDLIAQLSLTAFKNWNADIGLQWNPNSSQSETSLVKLQYRPDSEHVLNFGYRFQRALIEQADVSGAWPIGRRWNLFARAVYDLQEHTVLDKFLGLEYKACCWRLRLVARRFVSSRTGATDTPIYLQLELNGLASVGVPADAFLESAIRGYSAPAANR